MTYIFSDKNSIRSKSNKIIQNFEVKAESIEKSSKISQKNNNKTDSHILEITKNSTINSKLSEIYMDILKTLEPEEGLSSEWEVCINF